MRRTLMSAVILKIETESCMIDKAFKSVMDPDSNGLNKLPKIVRFQLMVSLSFLWSVIFCISAGLFIWLPGYLLVHVVLLALGIFGTGWVFNTSKASPGGD
jgi:hypothetical protein